MTDSNAPHLGTGPTILPLDEFHVRAISIFVYCRRNRRGARTNLSRLRLTRPTKRYPCVVQGIGLTRRQFERLCDDGQVVVANFTIVSLGAQWDLAPLRPYIKLVAAELRRARRRKKAGV